MPVPKKQAAAAAEFPEFTVENLVFTRDRYGFIAGKVRVGPVRLTVWMSNYGSVTIENNPITDHALTLKIEIGVRAAALAMVIESWHHLSEIDLRRLKELEAEEQQ